MVENTLWVEKYRPKILDDYIGNEDFVRKVEKWIEIDDIPSLLLHSVSPGSGKTTAAKIIANTLDADIMYINASDENNIETVRDKIKTYVSSQGFNHWKIVILDECLKFDTLIHVIRDGIYKLIPIMDLIDSTDLILTYNLVDDKIEYEPFTVQSKGKRQIYEIEFDNGQIVECSDTHKWYVFDGNEIRIVQTKELKRFGHIMSPI